MVRGRGEGGSSGFVVSSRILNGIGTIVPFLCLNGLGSDGEGGGLVHRLLLLPRWHVFVFVLLVFIVIFILVFVLFELPENPASLLYTCQLCLTSRSQVKFK